MLAVPLCHLHSDNQCVQEKDLKPKILAEENANSIGKTKWFQ